MWKLFMSDQFFLMWIFLCEIQSGRCTCRSAWIVPYLLNNIFLIHARAFLPRGKSSMDNQGFFCRLGEIIARQRYFRSLEYQKYCLVFHPRYAKWVHKFFQNFQKVLKFEKMISIPANFADKYEPALSTYILCR
jgi:hypothetical protein